jgi:DNA-binding protein H-NS
VSPTDLNLVKEKFVSNLIDIQSQIEKLQKQANEIKAKEFGGTVQDILEKMQAFGITLKDLQNAKPVKATKAGRGKSNVAIKPVKANKKTGVPVAAKYRGPNGESWSGRGLTPKWLTALIAQGHTKESFAVNAQ